LSIIVQICDNNRLFLVCLPICYQSINIPLVIRICCT